MYREMMPQICVRIVMVYAWIVFGQETGKAKKNIPKKNLNISSSGCVSSVKLCVKRIKPSDHNSKVYLIHLQDMLTRDDLKIIFIHSKYSTYNNIDFIFLLVFQLMRMY